MSALKLLEQTAATEHHARAREAANAICNRVVEMMNERIPALEIHCSLEALFEKYRVGGDSVMRDAFAEVLEWFEDENIARSA